ncbi:nucleoside hydrolase [Escherichia coli]|uniref:nucleoside hydrolase n=1 Tax=Escherichia coli TaxID=562 RepID=UPI0024DF1B8F|nr:nucleoside hydrolase [Escherichia coli]
MTTVAGNVSVEKTTRNALQLLHFWNAEIPLAQGAAVPLVRAPRDAAICARRIGNGWLRLC